MKKIAIFLLFFLSAGVSWGATVDRLPLSEIQVMLSGCEQESEEGVLACSSATYVGNDNVYLRSRSFNAEGRGTLELNKLDKFKPEEDEVIFVAPSEYNRKSPHFDPSHQGVLEGFDWSQADWDPKDFDKNRIPFSTYSVGDKHVSVYMYYDLDEGVSQSGHVSAVGYVYGKAFRDEGEGLIYSLSWQEEQSQSDKNSIMHDNIEIINIVEEGKDGLTSVVAGVQAREVLGYVITNPFSVGAAGGSVLMGAGSVGFKEALTKAPQVIKTLSGLLMGTGVTLPGASRVVAEGSKRATKKIVSHRLAKYGFACLAAGGAIKYFIDNAVGTTVVLDGEGNIIKTRPTITGFPKHEVCDADAFVGPVYGDRPHPNSPRGQEQELGEEEFYSYFDRLNELLEKGSKQQLTDPERKELEKYYGQLCGDSAIHILLNGDPEFNKVLHILCLKMKKIVKPEQLTKEELKELDNTEAILDILRE